MDPTPKRKSKSPYDGFSEADLQRIRKNAPVADVEFHRSLDSTNSRALQIGREGSCPLPRLVLAENQTHGRGRNANRWWSVPGALTFSLLLEQRASSTSGAQNFARASLAAGLALCDALERFLPGAALQVKWPNDVYANGRKISGLLIESPAAPSSMLVLGIGLNVNNSFADAPESIAKIGTSLCDIAQRKCALADVLLEVLAQRFDQLASLGPPHDELVARWNRRCLLTGKRIQVETSSGKVTGLCQGIDSSGALIVQSEQSTHTFHSGSITLLESS